MKTLSGSAIALLTLALSLINLELLAQDPSSVAIKQKIDNKTLSIDIESVSPLRGSYRHLSPGYTFMVRPDTVATDLPYFGRAYQAPIGTNDAGIKFISVDFEYTVKDRKKGGWDVVIKPKDVPKFPKVILNFMTNGSVSIRVLPTDRESISYSGKIREN